MANRRMFSLDVVDTDRFLEMPTSTQALYFHLGMRADDEGFVASPKKITNFVGCNEDDLKLLAVKKFITPFESGIIVITEWNVHNWIRSDRKHETRFQDEKSMLSLCGGIYVLADNVQPIDRQMSDSWHPEVRLGKDSIDKNKEDIYELIQTFKSNLTPTDYEMINEVIDKYTLEQFEEAIEISKSNNAKTIKYLIQVLKNPIRNKKVMKRPKWMDEDLTRKDVKLTDEEQRELDEIIKGS